jgi:flagellar basal body P-ring formation protein FlgA
MVKCCQLLVSLAVGLTVAPTAQAETMALPVPTRTILPGQLIDEADFSRKNFEVSSVAKLNFVVSLDQMQHKEAARILMAGKPIPISSLTKAKDVHKGQQTIAHFSEDGIDIQGFLSPLNDAAAGQIVRCRNPSSGIMVDALVMENGSLSVSER